MTRTLLVAAIALAAAIAQAAALSAAVAPVARAIRAIEVPAKVAASGPTRPAFVEHIEVVHHRGS
jgi:hypothetical protein